MFLLAFIIDLFGIISTKQELDHAADQMVKQIQLSGGINSETAREAAAAGVDVCVAGTGVFKAPDVKAAILELRNA